MSSSSQESSGSSMLTTKHGRLRSYLAEQITSGSLGEGQFLPSEPALAKQFDISRGTVRQALAELQNDGLVERIPGKGTLVCAGGSRPQSQQQVVEEVRTSLSLLAIVLPEIRTGHYPALVHSFDEAAAEMHHQILCCTTGNDVRRQGDIVLQLIDKHVAGVALSPPTIGAPPVHQVRQLQNHDIPVVLLHRGVEGISVPVIAMPYERIARKAASEILKLGHRQIAFVVSHQNVGASRYQLGFEAALNEVGCQLNPELVHYGKSPLGPTGTPSSERLAEIERVLDKMLDLPEERRPTAIFDPWDADAEAIYLALAQRGVKIPSEFSLLSFGGASRSGALSTRITSVTVDEPGFARRAVGLLEKMHRGDDPISNSQQFEVDISFFVGQTLGPAPH